MNCLHIFGPASNRYPEKFQDHMPKTYSVLYYQFSSFKLYYFLHELEEFLGIFSMICGIINNGLNVKTASFILFYTLKDIYFRFVFNQISCINFSNSVQILLRSNWSLKEFQLPGILKFYLVKKSHWNS